MPLQETSLPASGFQPTPYLVFNFYPPYLRIFKIVYTNNMQKILPTLLLLLVTKFTIAQNVDVVDVKKFKALAKDKATEFIHPKTDTSALQFVASFKATAKDSTALPGDLYQLIKDMARVRGSNCFILRSLSYDSLKRLFIDIDAYYATETIMAANKANYETNEVFVFGSEQSTKDSFSLKVNNGSKTFASGTYLKFTLTEGESLRLNKGGFTGGTWKLKYHKAQEPLYLMVISGFAFGNGPLPPPGTIGISFTTGQIKQLTDDYAQFLIQILKRSE